MIRVHAPSRLHFGLLSLSTEECWPDREGNLSVAARRFGGVGLMIESPGVRVVAEPAADWNVRGPLAERSRAAALRLAETLPADARQPLHIHIEHYAAEHAGLGTGTQLELAVGRAVAAACGLELNAVELARRLGAGNAPPSAFTASNMAVSWSKAAKARRPS